MAYLGDLLSAVREQSPSAVLALLGDWGSGKSTILEMLMLRLAERNEAPWLVATFNPWTYPDSESLQRGFFSELRAAMPSDVGGGKARESLGELARTLSPFGALAGVVGIDGERLIRHAGDLISGDSSVSAKQREAEKSLAALGRPVLMIIDDLDRLTPNELLEVLKFVRLIGRLPHVYYLLSYDEQTLLDVLARTELVGAPDRAKLYLEKIVQVRVDMPVLRESQRAVLFDAGLRAIMRRNGLELTSDDTTRLTHVYERALDPRMATPRAINRFLGQVEAFYPPLHGEVDFVDFLLVSWLRTYEPRVYRLLSSRSADFLGNSVYEAMMFRDDDVARKDHWYGLIRSVGVLEEHIDGVAEVLAALFPHVRRVLGSTMRLSDRNGSVRGIGNPYYFDRYLAFGVPEEDMPDSLVRAAVDGLQGAHGHDEAVSRLAMELTSSTDRTLRKLEALRLEGAQLPEGHLFGLFSDVADRAHLETALFIDPYRQLVTEGVRSLGRLSGPDRARRLQDALSSPDTFTYAVNVGVQAFREAADDRRDALPDDALQGVVDEVSRGLAARFRSAVTPSVDEVEWSLLTKWHELRPREAEVWLRERFEAAHWTTEQVLPMLVSSASVTGADGTRPALGSFALDLALGALGQDALSQAVDRFDEPLPQALDTWETEPTPANRLLHSLIVIRDRRGEWTPADSTAPRNEERDADDPGSR